MSNRKKTPSWAKYRNQARLNRGGGQYRIDEGYERFLRLNAGNIANIQDSDRTLLKAPDVFSILNNREETIDYFNSVLNQVKKRVFTLMDVSKVTRTDLPTVSILISIMMDERQAANNVRRYLKVTVPTGSNQPGQLFQDVQFDRMVTKKGVVTHGFFLSRRSTDINDDYQRDILNSSANFFGESLSLSSLNPILVEMISNTNNHAAPNEDDEHIPWFISIIEDEENAKMCYSIVDLGIGVYESIKTKGIASTGGIKTVLDKFTEFISGSQSDFLRRNIPKGIDSTTKLFYRGQGLQRIYQLANSGPYLKFEIITNKGAVNLLNPTREEKDSLKSFEGTVYYWEIGAE